MSLESFNFIDSLNASNPTTTDNVSEGDDHIRGIKSTLKTTFPSINAAITATDEEINLLDGVTATTAELNYVDGVTSNIQTQLGTKLPLAGGTMTGTIAGFTSTGIDDNATSTAITIDASKRVGIGRAPTISNSKLEVGGADNASLINVEASGVTGGMGVGATGLQLFHGSTSRVAISSGGDVTVNTGNLVIGTSGKGIMFSPFDETVSTPGSDSNLLDDYEEGNYTATLTMGSGTASPAKAIHVIGTGTAPARLVRTGSDGQIIQLYRDNSSVGSVGGSGGNPFIANSASRGISLGSNVVPCDSNGSAVDNLSDLGTASARFDDIYATNGTIQTSDRNEKQDIEELSTAEKAVATACKGLLRKFRWIDSVAEKGDDARIHFGIIAQDLQDAFTAEGLDAGRYAMFISTTWYEKLVPVDAVIGVEAAEATYDDEGAELTPAVEAVEAKDAYTRTDTEDEPTDGYTERTRLGVRYRELLAFIISAM